MIKYLAIIDFNNGMAEIGSVLVIEAADENTARKLIREQTKLSLEDGRFI